MRTIPIPASRQKEIYEYIERYTSANVKELADHFGVSEVTIRRDLDDLNEAGFVERTHGGALHIDKSTAFELNHSKKRELMCQEKKRIGKKALEYVRNGDTIFLDTGTTTFCIAAELWAFEDLTVITNDLHIADSVVLDKSSQLIVTGGIRRYDFGVLIGSVTDDFLRGVNMNTAFMSADSISLKMGVTNANITEANAKRIAMQQSNVSVLVADHTKVGMATFARVAPLSQYDVIIMDDGLSEENAAAIRKETDLILV